MSYRFMRIIIMFDLPVQSSIQRKKYRDFRKLLRNNGFYMLQESVYCRLALNKTAVDTVLQKIRKKVPEEGLIQSLVVTEKQFIGMEYILGESKTDVVNSDERIISI